MEFDQLFSPDRPQPTCKEVVCAVAKDTIANTPRTLLNFVKRHPLASLTIGATIAADAAIIGLTPNSDHLLGYLGSTSFMLGVIGTITSYQIEDAFRSDCVQSALIAFRHYRQGSLNYLTMQDIQDELRHPGVKEE